MNMKINKIILGLFVLTLTVTSCNKDWEGEQYEQYISLKAQMNSSGVTTIYVRYRGDGKRTYELPVIVSGSTVNEKDRNVRIVEDLDTLNTMNLARFGTIRTDLYYKPLEKGSFYEIPEIVNIPKGESIGIANIDFNLEGIDMNEKWVVPLRVSDDSSYDYTANPRKNYAEAILRVYPFNDFSGGYSTSTQTVTMLDEDGESAGSVMTTTKRTAYVVNENTVFFYAGLINEELEDRHKYKFEVEFLGADSENPQDKKIKVTCDNADEIDFQLHTTEDGLKYSTNVIKDATKPYLEHHYVTINIDYSFNDISSSKDADGNVIPIRYRVTGAMILERNINTLIPDEDQAIEW